MQFKKLANRIGFTETEFKVLAFLSLVFVGGLLIKFYNIDKSVYKNYDYTKADSLFLASDSLKGNEEESNVSIEKKDEYKKEVLGFDESKPAKYEKKESLSENSINLNTASKDELMKLPGIGEKTAVRIIEQRNKTGRFRSIEELMEVKGIQSTKLNKIKNYIYVK
ncbi:MAG: helix-hairpin-helix domain-containing protein [Ignavibacteriales bacterium]|nr:helix-hairpin-helix domain-containing protein [Ignavibacteriales bacterium]